MTKKKTKEALKHNRTNPSTPELDAMRKMYVNGIRGLRSGMDTALVHEGYIVIGRRVWRDMIDTLDGLREISERV